MNRSGIAVTTVVSLAAIALVAGIVINWPSASREVAQEDSPSPLISQPRPAFTMPDLAGTHRDIKDWDGKVLAVNFWATWCEPCKQEIADFNTLQRQYGAKGLQFVGVAIDSLDSVQAYVKTRPFEYPLLVGGEEEAVQVATRYGDDQGVVPYTVFIDRQGRIAFVQYGQISQGLARQVIESLL